MSFLSLTLGVGHLSGAESGGFKPSSKTETEKVLARDDFTCRFCGFRSTQYQRVVPFEGSSVTVCTFCEQVLFLERAGIMGSGVLIWLPEITQAELNHITRAIYIARADESSELAAAANRALDALMARRTDAKKRLGSDDPLLLTSVLQEHLTDKERKDAVGKLDGIRLLPLDKHIVRQHGHDTDVFPRIVGFWRSEHGPFAALPTSDWNKLFAKIVA
ncbi:MAG: type IV secretion protein DotN [Bdellovibrionales bacterium]